MGKITSDRERILETLGGLAMEMEAALHCLSIHYAKLPLPAAGKTKTLLDIEQLRNATKAQLAQIDECLGVCAHEAPEGL